MFDIGFAEFVLVFVIGLLVLGPQRLPKVAAEIGKWVGRARRTATELRRQLEREIELAEMEKPPPPPPETPPPPPEFTNAAAPSAEQPSATPQVAAGAPPPASAEPTIHGALPTPPDHRDAVPAAVVDEEQLALHGGLPARPTHDAPAPESAAHPPKP
jgi:sec-independent protein translocase protein TatB